MPTASTWRPNWLTLPRMVAGLTVMVLLVFAVSRYAKEQPQNTTLRRLVTEASPPTPEEVENSLPLKTRQRAASAQAALDASRLRAATQPR